jgi:decaprenylphospho-beta-D-erythro-pentofuranosid-2-ulose 2-reductase
MKKIVIIGATSTIAQACAAQWLRQDDIDLVLVGRDERRIRQAMEALRPNAPAARMTAVVADFHDPTAIAQLASQLAAGQPIDIVLIAQGSYPDQRACQADPAQLRAALEINALSPVLFAEAFAAHMAAADHGTIALIGSLAGDRGRKSNYVYGAAKGLVARYAQGLRHRFAGSGVRVVLIKPGPIDTPMTAHAKSMGTKVAPVDLAARDIVHGIALGSAVVYTPRRWQFIMLAVMHLPDFVFNRLNI